jgi:malonyl-CoA O-methyltransferase
VLPSAPDPAAIRRAFGRAAAGFDATDFLHAELRDRLLDRLGYVRLAPATVLDLGCGTGGGTAALEARYPGARVVAVDAAAPMCRQAANRPLDGVLCAAAEALPLATGSVDLVYSNLLLQCCPDIGATLAEARRVLRHPGLFTFATLGPDTLIELRSAWAATDELPHVIAFPEMHLLGDALVRAGFAEPVVDTERLTVTYPDLGRLAAELRGVGAANPAAGRRRGLTGRGRWARMQAAYEGFRDAEGRLPVTVEVIYGQAWAGEPRAAVGQETSVPLSAVQRRRPY